MSKFIGALVDFGIAKETTRGTAESAATFWIPKASLSLDDMVEKAPDENSIGVIEDMPDTVNVHYHSEGEIEAKVGMDSMGLILYSLLGTLNTTGPTDSAYSHAFTVLQSAQHPSLTLFVDEENQDYQYPLGMVTNFELQAETNGYVNYTVGFRAKKGITDTLSPSYSSEPKALSQHVVVKTAATAAGLAAGTTQNIRSLSFSIEKNVEDDDALGNEEAVDILNKQFAAEGQFEIVYNAQTFKTEMLADTKLALQVKLTNTDETIDSGSTNPSVTFTFHKIKILTFERTFDNGEIVMANVSFKALYDTTDSKMISATVVNGVTAY